MTLISLVQFTDTALQKIQQLKNGLHITTDQYLRVGIKGAGCGTPAFLLAFDQKNEKDELYDIQGEKVIVAKGQSMYIMGMTIDYVEEKNSSGFVFKS